MTKTLKQFCLLTFVLLNPELSSLKTHTVDPDQLTSNDAIRSESTLFSTLIENAYLYMCDLNTAGLQIKMERM